MNLTNFKAKKPIISGNPLLSIFKSHSTSFFAAIIAIDALGEGHVIAINPDCLFETELFDGTTLSDNIDGFEKLKLKPGIYKSQIKFYTYRSNHPEDPEEWDMTITLEDIEEIDLAL